MKQWILGVTVVSSLVLGPFAVAEQRNHHDANRGHGQHDNRGHAQHDNRPRHSRYDGIVIGGYIQDVHGLGHDRSRGYGHQRDRHAHDRRCGHNRGHYRRRHGNHGHYGQGNRNHYRRNHDNGRFHSRHHYYQSERRISHVIRAY